VIKRIKPNIGL